MADQIPKSSRRFTKRFVIANLVLGWGLIFYSIYYQQAQFVVREALSLIGVIFAFYTGIGHMDYRKALDSGCETSTQNTGNEEG